MLALIGMPTINAMAAESVTKDNYVIAESDWYFMGVQKKVGVNVWIHDDPVSKDNQQVIAGDV